jgi:hypothetical protein
MMAEDMDLREEDRLPWLETVEPDEDESVGIGRVVALVVLGLGVLAAIIFGIYSLQHRQPAGDGQLIAAQEGDYKVKPTDPGGLKVEGEGNSAIATSAGKGAGNGAIDLRGVPETPVAGQRAKPAAVKDASGRNAVAQVPASGGRLVATAPVSASRPGGANAPVAGSLVQLGAFPSESVANAAWDRFSKRWASRCSPSRPADGPCTGCASMRAARTRRRTSAGGSASRAKPASSRADLTTVMPDVVRGDGIGADG